MRFEIETINPARAAQYLARNETNRPLQQTWINRLAETMVRGEWRLNGEAIKISANGEVLDGQHRLQAVVKSGVPLCTAIVHNVATDVFSSLDQGKRRSAADAFAIAGHLHTSKLSAATRALHAINNGGEFSKMASTPMLESVLSAHPKLIKWTADYVAHRGGALFQSSLIAVITLGDEKHGEIKAQGFFDPLMTGTNMAPGCPMLVLRQKMIEQKSNTRNTAMRTQTQAAYAIKAWNAYIIGKPLTFLRWQSEEVFPTMR